MTVEGSLRSPSSVQYAADCESEIAAVLAVRGQEAGHYQVLGPDPWQVVWNPGRTGFASFLEGRRCLFSWRSPVGAPADQPELLARLADHAERVGKPLFAALVSGTACSAGIRLGMTPIWAGSETFIQLPVWSTGGGQRRRLRYALNQARTLGLGWREAFPLVNDDDRVGLLRVEREWKAERAERHTDAFQRTASLELADIRRYFVCDGPGGIIASVTCTPINARSWYLQDVVRAPDAPRGALEGAMACALEGLRDDGFELASLGPLPFWQPEGAPADARRVGPVADRVIRFFDRLYRFRGISEFRWKFRPEVIEPLYILRSRRIITPCVALSLTRVLTQRVDHGAAADRGRAARPGRLTASRS